MFKALRPALLLLLACLPCAAAPSALDGLLGPEPAAVRVPLAAPAARASGDFSALPAYSFSYLNDLNTRLIDLSVASVDAVIFSVTLRDNPDALVRARDRGLKVRLIVDEQHVYPRADAQVTRLLKEPGIEVRTLRGTRAYGVNHNKILIGDKSAVATGSYNWTFGATFSNYENTLVARDPAYAAGYNAYFEWMWARSRTPEQGPSPEVPEGYYGLPPQDPAPAQALNGLPVPAYLFSPGSGSEERLAALIDRARVSADAVTFTFSSKILCDSLIAAHRRGVAVRFLTDRNMGASSAMVKRLFDEGVPVRWAGGRNEKGALHNKFLILDGKLLQTGSFNWTINASRNSFENMIFVSDPAGVDAYGKTFGWLYKNAAAPAAGEFEPAGAE